MRPGADGSEGAQDRQEYEKEREELVPSLHVGHDLGVERMGGEDERSEERPHSPDGKSAPPTGHSPEDEQEETAAQSVERDVAGMGHARVVAEQLDFEREGDQGERAIAPAGKLRLPSHPLIEVRIGIRAEETGDPGEPILDCGILGVDERIVEGPLVGEGVRVEPDREDQDEGEEQSSAPDDSGGRHVQVWVMGHRHRGAKIADRRPSETREHRRLLLPNEAGSAFP
jgi:hypothetical protein